MLNSKFRVAVLLASMLLVAFGAFAQTAETGAIAGTVITGGTPLPGVTVEARSPQLQGVRTAVTDAGGNFRFTLLPPGRYTVTATLSGFNTVTQNNVAVSLNHTVTLEVTLSAAASETMTVTGAAPVVDVTSNISGANVTSETMQSLPIGRNFVAAAQVAPGTSNDASGTTVYGSSGAENQYVIDGLNTTGVQTGQQGKRLNQEFIQEVEVMTGGLPAEYGRMTGGTINAVTKSGSNEYHGDVFGYNTGGRLTSRTSTASRLPTTATTVGDVSRQGDYGADLGGYILKDRLWFFGAYDRTTETDRSTRINTGLNFPGVYTLPVGGSVDSKLNRDLYAGKLSLSLTSSQLFNLSLFGDPSKQDGAIFALSGPPSVFEGTQTLGGNDVNGRYSGVFGTNWNVNAQAGKHNERAIIGGPGLSIPQVIDQTIVPTVRTGGYGYIENTKFKRNTAKLDVASFFGSHQIKFGGDAEDLKAQDTRFFSGGDRPRRRCSVTVVNNQCPANGFIYYIHEAYVNTTPYANTPAGAALLQPNLIPQLQIAPETKNTGLYLQDAWKVLTNFTINAGVRWETQKLLSAQGETSINLKKNIAPRLGVIWDVANNGRSKLYGNYGRFYEAIPMDINIRTFGGETTAQTVNFDATPGHITPDPTAPKLSGFNTQRFRILGSEPAPVDPNIKGQYVDEYLAGYDYEFAPNFAVGIKGTYRNLGRVIEDMSVATADGGTYKVANPGEGEGKTTTFLFQDGEVAVPKPKRQYKGVEFHANKRFSNNYQLFGSYVWSRLQGNYDGTFQASTGQLDPNINSAYDYGEFAVNNQGYLSNDRTHQAKIYGSYTFGAGMAKGLDIGFAARYESGAPLTAYGYEPFAYRNYEMYLTPRGSLGRGPSDYEADVHLGFPIAFGASSRLTLLADVFNVFNRQSITALDMRYELTSDAPCAGIPDALCNGANGIATVTNPDGTPTLTPVGQLANPRATAPNPNFLKAGTSFTPPRSIRIGARYTF